MLQFMRKQARSWFVKILLGAIIVVFALYFGSMGGRGSAEAIATVNGKPITYGEFRTEYGNMIETLRQYYQGTLTDEMVKQLNLKQQAFDRIINRAVINEMAGRLHLAVTEGEIRQAIASYPAFQRDGAFSQEYYHRILKQNKLSAEDFEAMQKNAILAEKLRKLVTEGAVVSDLEAREYYRLQNEKINLQFVRVSPESFRSRVKYSDSELEKYLKDNPESFRVQEKIQAQYILFSASDLAGAAEITEDEINSFYSLYGKKFAKAGKTPPLSEIRGKIVGELKIHRGMDAAAREAKKAYETIYQENNFEEYARKNNLRIHSTEVFTKDSIPVEFRGLRDISAQLFTLKKDDVAAPVPSEKGFYLFRAVSQTPSYVPSLKEAKKSVENAYINVEASKLAGTEADRILGELKKGADFGRVCSENGLKVSETGMFIAGVPRIPNIGDSREISLSLAQLSEKNPYPGKVFEVNGSPVIVKFKDRQLAAEEGFNKEALKSIMTRAKENSLYEAWLSQAKDDLGKSGKLKIIKDVKDL
jgi:peptidyl-prolyl cis-trans isomerase D